MANFDAFILAHLSDQRLWLAEFLADIGYDVTHSGWGLGTTGPRLIVADQPLDPATAERLQDAITAGRIGVIVLGAPPFPPDAFFTRADARLSLDATGREVAMAVELVGRIVELRDVQRREQEECLHWIQLAMHDSLTGLPNRRAWDERLANELAGRLPLAVGLVDVDFFKQINDQKGHNTGDTVLRQAANVMRSRLRRHDFVARIGGDEFGVIIQQVNRPMAIKIFDRLRSAVSAQLAQLELPPATLSAGFVTLGPHEPRVASDVFASASKSLQAAKQSARNRTVGSAVMLAR
jgi:diguanylate cyclase (GGDEF)-like protein